MKTLTLITIIFSVALTGACSNSAEGDVVAAEPAERQIPEELKKEMTKKQRAHGDRDANGVENLPYAGGKTFHSLDEYLAHLEKNAAIDLPYWRETAPGEYEWVTTVRSLENDGKRETATREELLERYGFDE